MTAVGTTGSAALGGGAVADEARGNPPHRERAIEELFATHHLPLVRLAALLGADDAENIVAEAFYQLFRRWAKLRTADAAAGYLRATVVNLTRMRLRHLLVVRRHVERAVPPNCEESGEQQLLVREDQRAVMRAVRDLPSRQREALVLRFWLDLSERQIAEAMRVSPGSVKSHMSRGMAALTRRLEDWT